MQIGHIYPPCKVTKRSERTRPEIPAIFTGNLRTRSSKKVGAAAEATLSLIHGRCLFRSSHFSHRTPSRTAPLCPSPFPS